jgi:hypothetical protein
LRKTLINLQELSKSVIGYIRISTLSENDFEEVVNKFQVMEFDLPEQDTNALRVWFRYKVDIFLLNYYGNYKKSGDTELNEKIENKVRFLHDKLTQSYPEYIGVEGLEQRIEPVSIAKMKKYINVLIETCYPHQLLVFGFRELVDDWSTKRIVQELGDVALDNIYCNFVNIYANQSGVPVYVIGICFIKLQEKLNFKLKDILFKNDGVTKIKLKAYLEYITGQTLLNYYYEKERDIYDWCNKVKRRSFKRIFDMLDIYTKID